MSPKAQPKFKNVKIIGDCTIYQNVKIGEGSVIEGPCILGKPPRGKKDGELKLVIGKNAVIRPFTTIYAGNKIGDNFQTGQGASIREDNVIGNNVSVGTNAVLEFENRIGNHVRIHSLCFLEMVTIGNNVFFGPNVVFTDDPHPMLCPKYKECKGGVKVADLVKIGAHSTLCPGVKIGRNALVGAGSVVTKDIPANAVAAGNPARVIKKITDLVCYIGAFERPYVWPPYKK
ncbi:MAG: DapH/DapD/GlmU-related protein [Candidatus Zixiibacteriota bacterium]